MASLGLSKTEFNTPGQLSRLSGRLTKTEAKKPIFQFLSVCAKSLQDGIANNLKFCFGFSISTIFGAKMKSHDWEQNFNFN